MLVETYPEMKASAKTKNVKTHAKKVFLKEFQTELFSLEIKFDIEVLTLWEAIHSSVIK